MQNSFCDDYIYLDWLERIAPAISLDQILPSKQINYILMKGMEMMMMIIIRVTVLLLVLTVKGTLVLNAVELVTMRLRPEVKVWLDLYLNELNAIWFFRTWICQP